MCVLDPFSECWQSTLFQIYFFYGSARDACEDALEAEGGLEIPSHLRQPSMAAWSTLSLLSVSVAHCLAVVEGLLTWAGL